MSVTNLSKEEMKNSTASSSAMFDSGISSLRLSMRTNDSLTSSMADSAVGSPRRGQTQPQEEICGRLRGLNINGGGSLQLDSEDLESQKLEVWREYYEPDEDGDVQLHLAIASGYVEVVDALIRLAPHSDLLSLQNNASYAPIHIAVLQNQPHLVRRLVIAGARLCIRDRDGNSPLHLAARRGFVECAEALLQPVSSQELQDAEIQDLIPNSEDENAKEETSKDRESASKRLHAKQEEPLLFANNNGEYPVHLAVMGGHAEFLRFLSWQKNSTLSDRCADVLNLGDGRGGRTALHFAVAAANVAVIQCLITPLAEAGCEVDVNRLDWYGQTPYQLARLNGAAEVAEFLVRISGDRLNVALNEEPIHQSVSMEDCGGLNGADSEDSLESRWGNNQGDRQSQTRLLNSSA